MVSVQQSGMHGSHTERRMSRQIRGTSGSAIDAPLLLGIDLGTSRLKVALFNERGELLFSSSGALTMLSACPGIYEQDSRTWWQTLCGLIGELAEQVPNATNAIGAIGVCGQSHGPTPISRRGEPLGPCMTWLDRRGEQDVEWILRVVGDDLLLREGNPPADTCYTAAKLLWIKRRSPALFEEVHKFLLPKDVLVHWLTGAFCTDRTDASVTNLFSEQAMGWSDAILDRLRIDREKLPTVREAWDIAGEVTREAALATGLREGTPVIVGAADWASTYFGAGGVRPGVVFDVAGTVGAILCTTSRDIGMPHTIGIIPGLRHAFGCCVESSAASYEWFRKLLGESNVSCPLSLEELDAMAAEAPAGACGVLAIPKLAGARRPENSMARGAIMGLSLSSNAAHVARAILEGVAYEYRAGVERLRGAGIACERLRAVGGGARSEVWRQIKADVMQAEYEITNREEAGAFGVAMVAGFAVGVFASVESPIERFVTVARTTQPRAERSALYDGLYRIYRDVSQALEAERVHESLDGMKDVGKGATAVADGVSSQGGKQA